MTGVVNVAFLPLEDVSPRAAQIHAAAKAQVEEGIASGKYSAGLAEQYAIQLARIERKAAGSEYLTVPGLLSFPSACILVPKNSIGGGSDMSVACYRSPGGSSEVCLNCCSYQLQLLSGNHSKLLPGLICAMILA